ncbi:MAG: amidohydrolase family protein [Bryobacteraceae bacterium]
MWIRKHERDRRKGVDSPVPTQFVSNEEFIPRPQNRDQRQVEHFIGEMSDSNSRRLGISRRDYMRTGMGLATCFLAANRVYGEYWEVEAAEAFEPAATAEKYPKGEYFVLDVQAHFTDGYALNFRTDPIVKGMGFQLKDDAESYSYRTFVKEMFFDSETDMIILSGVPGREVLRDAQGNVPEGRKRGGGIFPSWLMSQAKKQINDLAGSTRALCQGNLAPNHYWNRETNSMDKAAILEQMEREIKQYGIHSWKWYCHTDPGKSGGGFQLDDPNAFWFYEESRKRGIKLISVHKGYSYQSRTLGHLANPKDVEKAALAYPDFNFVIYHSALQHGINEPEFKDPAKVNPTTGDMAWHDVLMDIKRRNPKIDNVYPELGSFFGPLVLAHPGLAMHGIGKNIKHYGVDRVIWGTDCIWWGSPQWLIEAFKRFQISDEYCEKFGYKKLSKKDKAKILGLNAAKLYGIDVKKKRGPLPADALDRLKTAYLEDGGQPDNAAHGWVRAAD